MDMIISIYWEHAMNVTLREIVYLHCHQDAESDWIVLVGQDGVQRPPVHFPRGGHLLAFLSCLENGLLPHGQLDPPLWSQTGKGEEEQFTGSFTHKLGGSLTLSFYGSFGFQKRNVQVDEILNELTGKMFPKLRRRGSRIHRNGAQEMSSSGNGNVPEVLNGENGQPQADFVFRMLYNSSRAYEQSKSP